MKLNEDKGPDTRQRLLNAAGEVFARLGYRAATVREISQMANANVAAVNYHFRDKEGLYIAVLEQTLRLAVERYPLAPGSGQENATARERLHAFIRSFLLRLLDEGRPAWHGKLVAREITEPSAAFGLVIEEVIRPLHELLGLIVREFLGEGADEKSTRLCVFSIIGQCLFYHHSRQVIEHLYPRQFGPSEIEDVAEHITRFSLRAMQQGLNEA